ncbi:MAG: C10 family peptidase [bacterium]
MRFHLFKWSCLILFASGLCTALAVPVPKGRATELATGWLREGTARLGRKMNSKVHAEVSYRDEAGDVSFYAIQLAPEGFIIVSADDAVEPVIAFSESGTTNDLVAGSPLFAMLSIDLPERNKHARVIESAYAESQRQPVNNAKPSRRPEHARNNKNRWEKYANPAKAAGTKATLSSSALQADPTVADAEVPVYGGLYSISDVRIAPIISSRWDQQTAQGQSCYNFYTPNNYYAGCVAIAVSQLIRYWQYPVTGIGHITRNITVNGVTQSATTRGGNGAGGPYNWSQMPLNPQTATYNLAQWQMIGSLCYDAGVIASMGYTATGSSANLLIASELTQSFGFGSAHDLWVNGGISAVTRDRVLMSNLAAGYPVITGIRQTVGNSGHAIITDGFGYSSGVTYFHVNYGWGMSGATAWYNMPTMDSSPAYNLVDVLIYNIFPTNTGEIVSGRIVSGSSGLQGVTVVLTSAGTNSYSAVTDANGYYGVIVPGGATYAMTATKTGYSSGQITDVVVGSSSQSYAGPCGNYFAQDLALAAPSIPTLTEWGMIILAVLVLIMGSQVIRLQQVTYTDRAA